MPFFPHSLYSVGNPHDQNDKVHSLLLFLAPHKLGLFRVSLLIPNGICSNKVLKKIKLFLVVKALFLRTFRVWFFSSKFVDNVPITKTECKIVSKCSREFRPDFGKALTSPERAWFSTYFVLYLNISKGILKSPTLCRAKNRNKLGVSSHLIRWIPHTVVVYLKIYVPYLQYSDSHVWANSADSDQTSLFAIQQVRILDMQTGDCDQLLNDLSGAMIFCVYLWFALYLLWIYPMTVFWKCYEREIFIPYKAEYNPHLSTNRILIFRPKFG